MLQFLPVIGYNRYDRLMVGAALHNITLPGNRFQFIAIPLYSTGSKQLNGISRISWGFYPTGNANRLNFALNMARFTGNVFTTEQGLKIKLGWNKRVPEIKYSWRSKDFTSKRSGFIQWKSFFILFSEIDYKCLVVEKRVFSVLKKTLFSEKKKIILKKNILITRSFTKQTLNGTVLISVITVPRYKK